MQRISKTLLKYCNSPEDKELLKQQLEENPFLIKVLIELLEDHLKIKEKERLKNKHYDSSGWGYRMADYNGEIRTFNFLLDILK